MKRLALIIMLFLGWQTGRAQLVINELMQSNVDCIMDDLNEFPDSWVEIYNTGETAVNLKDYRLGITNQSSEAWQLPDQMITPGSYVLVYCDKEAMKVHTNFRLDSGKGAAVYLFQNGEVADKVTDLKKQPAPNIAYGRKTDGGSEWGYQLVATPNAQNCGETTDRILDNPIFSEQGRVVTGSLSLSLALSLPEGSPDGAEIRYTVDGTEPTSYSIKYAAPISITSNCVVRAKVFCDGWLSPRSVTQSYILFPRRLTLPVISITTNSKYLTDSKLGIYVDGNSQSGKKNYEFNWRRPMNIELFDGEGKASVINQLCEARVMGGATRGEQLKSLAFYANKRFGTKHINYELFPDQRPGVNEFKSFALRNSGNDFNYLYMRDPIIQRTMASHVDLDWQAWKPAIIFMNGTYKGILNIRERSNEDNVWANYDGLEDIDMIKIAQENSRMVELLQEGDWQNYNIFKAFYNAHNHTLQEYAERMDWEEYINLMVMNFYYNNQDFPGNNMVLWRPRAEGGRWRWIAKDTDFGLGLYGSSANYKTLEWIYNPNYDWGRAWANTYEATRLFRRLMEDPDFQREFIDRAAIYMGDFLNEQGTRAVWDPMYDQIKYEYPYHRELINPWWPNYNEELSSARRWLSQRTAYFYQQLGDYYKLGSPVMLTVNKSVDEEVGLTFNGIRLSRGVFDGKFFADRKVTLEGHAPEGKVITGWRIKDISKQGLVTNTEVTGASYTFVMPASSALAIDAVLGEASAINSVPERPWTWHRDGARLILSAVPAGTHVQLYDLRGMLLHSVVSDGSDIIFSLLQSSLHVLKVGNKVIKL